LRCRKLHRDKSLGILPSACLAPSVVVAGLDTRKSDVSDLRFL
jgi:hypothetical protein